MIVLSCLPPWLVSSFSLYVRREGLIALECQKFGHPQILEGTTFP